jgi:putative NIF3 family GTP cyclohydrolase 1 type 2
MDQIKVKDIISHLEYFSPPALQEDYDNSGLQIGNPDMPVLGILIKKSQFFRPTLTLTV